MFSYSSFASNGSTVDCLSRTSFPMSLEVVLRLLEDRIHLVSSLTLVYCVRASWKGTVRGFSAWLFSDVRPYDKVRSTETKPTSAPRILEGSGGNAGIKTHYCSYFFCLAVYLPLNFLSRLKFCICLFHIFEYHRRVQ